MRRRALVAWLLVGWLAHCGNAVQRTAFPVPPSEDWQSQMGAPVSPEEAAQLREEVREMVRRTERCADKVTDCRTTLPVHLHLRQLHAPRLSARRAAAAELHGGGASSVQAQPRSTLTNAHALTPPRTRWAATR